MDLAKLARQNKVSEYHVSWRSKNLPRWTLFEKVLYDKAFLLLLKFQESVVIKVDFV